MAAFAALIVLVVALLFVFNAPRFATASEFPSRIRSKFEEAANSERGEAAEHARAEASVLEGRTVEARQLDMYHSGQTDGAAASQNDKPGDGWKLASVDDVSEEIKKEPDSRVSEKLSKLWPREKSHKSKEENSSQGLKSAASRRASGFGKLRLDHSVDVMQDEIEIDLAALLSVENKSLRSRTLQESQDPSQENDPSNTRPPARDDQTNKTGDGPEVAIQDRAKGLDPTDVDREKENHGAAANDAPNINNTLSEVSNNSSELKNDVRDGASSESSKQQPCCEGGKKLKACLSGDGAEELSLSVNSYDALHIIVKTPPYLIAHPAEFELGKGETKLVQIRQVHVETGRDVTSPQISIISESDACSIDVPTENLRYVSSQGYFYGFPYSAMSTPIVGFAMLFAVLVLFLGIWSWCKCLGRRRHGDSLKYQELEMSHSSVVDHRDEESNGWDEVWDDSWEDTEAARPSSRLTQSLSSKGLAPRRSNKETWEKWDD